MVRRGFSPGVPRRPCLLSAAVGAVLASSGCASSPPPSGSPPPRPLPCDVDAVLVGVCQTCHSAPPRNGAPIPLVTYEDTQAPFTLPPAYEETPTWRVMADVVAAGWMPQPWPGLTLTAAQRETLLDWTDAGAPAAPGGTRCP